MIHVVCPNPALDRTVFLKKFEINGVSRAQSSKDLLGGKGFNVIRSYRVEKETPPYLIHTFLGGYTGGYLKALIQEENVECMATEVNEATRICSIIVDAEKKQAHLINENGPSIDKSERQLYLKRLFNAVNTGDYAIFSGSLPQGLEPDFYANIIEDLEKRGVKCVLDSSGLALAKGIRANPWLIKVNELEFFELIGKTPETVTVDSIEKALRELDSPSNIIVTLGGKGTIAKYENVVYRVSLPKIEVKNATASGDIFLGGLTKSLHNGETIEKALETASLYSLSNCLYWYPNIELFDVNDYQSQIKLIKLGGYTNETITR